jgi:Tol biopolymer transport system component
MSTRIDRPGFLHRRALVDRRRERRTWLITAAADGAVHPATAVVIGTLLAVAAMIAVSLRSVVLSDDGPAGTSVALSATARNIAPTEDPDRHHPIHLAYLDIPTGETHPLPRPIGTMPLARTFMVSPGGHMFAFEALAGSRMQIFLSDVTGDRVHQLTDMPAGARLGGWSSDGRSIVVRTKDVSLGLARIATVDVRSGAVHPLTPSSYVLAPTFSPDGRWVLYTRARRDHSGDWRTDLWRVSSTGGSSERLIAFATLGSYSPDGSTIAYHRMTTIPSAFCDCWPLDLQLTRVPSDGSKQPGEATGGQISSPPSIFEVIFPRWSPNGRWIVVGSPDSGFSRQPIYVRPADGGRGRQVAVGVQATWFDDHTLIVTDRRRFSR